MQIIEFTLCFILNLRFSSLISPFLHEKQCCIENEYLNSQMCRKDFSFSEPSPRLYKTQLQLQRLQQVRCPVSSRRPARTLGQDGKRCTTVSFKKPP